MANTLTKAIMLFFVGAFYKMWLSSIKDWKHFWKKRVGFYAKYFLATGFFNNVKGIVT